MTDWALWGSTDSRTTKRLGGDSVPPEDARPAPDHQEAGGRSRAAWVPWSGIARETYDKARKTRLGGMRSPPRGYTRQPCSCAPS
jgi:hypothetical protein